jgi:hypothetical protein
MAQLISREELALVLDEDISQDRFDAVYSVALRAVRTGYSGDPEAATGRALDVVTGVLQGVIVRILANPKGVRTLGLGSANVTFGGKDTEVAFIFALTEGERADLAEVSSAVGSARGAFTIRPWRAC